MWLQYKFTTQQQLLNDMPMVADIQPDLCVLLIGGSDINSSLDPNVTEAQDQNSKITYLKLTAASLLHRRYWVSKIVVCQLLPWFPKYGIWSYRAVHRWHSYCVQAARVNNILAEEITSGDFPYLRFWCHQRDADTHHIYWAAVRSKGRREEVLSKYMPILNHVCNIHSGHGKAFPVC